MEWTAARLQAGMAEAFGEEYRNRDPMLTAATRPEFGDYQCNAVLPLAKLLSRKPRDAANELLGVLRLGGVFQEPTVTGPGFINLRLRPEFVVAQLEHMVRDKSGRLGIAPTQDPQRIVVDFSSPNIAKEMHVGHLRSTIIGDTLSRVLEFRGHHVLRLNHVGDWGTQFGMLITYLREHRPEALREMDEAQKGASGLGIAEGSVAGAAGSASIDLGDLVELYKEAKKRFDSDEAFRTASRNAVVALQAGEETSMAAWRLLCETSRREFQKIYDILDVELEERGESFYNPFLPAVVGGLLAAGLAEESEGAQVVWLDGYKSREGNGRQPLIVQKSDGGYMYSTTDLAAIRHRAEEERADRVLYVTDAGQATHFDQVFQVGRKAGFDLKKNATEGILVAHELRLEHVPFGLVQGEDGKKFKTRSGETVKLKDLLDEAVRIARSDLEERSQAGATGLDYEEVAKVVGIGAVKYADLAMNRESNYRFSYRKMLALNGNTAPYMLYAYARIQGIRRKASEGLAKSSNLSPLSLYLEHPAELSLATQLLRLPDVLLRLEADLYPNQLCDYLFETSQKFNKFYEQCPVNSAPTEAVRASRACICAATADTLKLALGLLGIGVVDRL